MSAILRFRDTTDPTKFHDVKALRGLSAYQLAVKNGYTGTEAAWLASITGVEGKSAYEVAKTEGYTGTKAEWLASLKGEKGDKGDPGAAGKDGSNGKSAYQLAQDGGYTGTQTDWLASLKGADAPDPSVVEKTITTSMWGSTVTISNALITATNSVAMIPGKNITDEQLKALQKANIQDCGTQAAGSITLKLFGTIPTIDIPVRLIIGGIA